MGDLGGGPEIATPPSCGAQFLPLTTHRVRDHDILSSRRHMRAASRCRIGSWTVEAAEKASRAAVLACARPLFVDLPLQTVVIVRLRQRNHWWSPVLSGARSGRCVVRYVALPGYCDNGEQSVCKIIGPTSLPSPTGGWVLMKSWTKVFRPAVTSAQILLLPSASAHSSPYQNPERKQRRTIPPSTPHDNRGSRQSLNWPSFLHLHSRAMTVLLLVRRKA